MRQVPPAPPPSSEAVRATMRGNRSTSRPEQRLRNELHRRGLRFRKHHAPLQGLRCRPDIVFTARRVVIFVDGCFWHRCPVHATEPSTNASYWQAKLDANVQRDRRNDRELAAAGWLVLRIWEHELPERAADKVERALACRL